MTPLPLAEKRATLVEKLLRRAAVANSALGAVILEHHGDGTGPDGAYWNGRREAFEEAARMVEADADFTLHNRLEALAIEMDEAAKPTAHHMPVGDGRVVFSGYGSGDANAHHWAGRVRDLIPLQSRRPAP